MPYPPNTRTPEWLTRLNEFFRGTEYNPFLRPRRMLLTHGQLDLMRQTTPSPSRVNQYLPLGGVLGDITATPVVVTEDFRQSFPYAMGWCDEDEPITVDSQIDHHRSGDG